MEISDEMNIIESPYCKKCDACGEDGCCSYISCFRQLIKDSNCSYGKTYLNDMLFDNRMLDVYRDAIEHLKNGKISIEAIQDFIDYKMDMIYDEIYPNDL